MGVASRAEPSPLGQRVMAAMPLGWQLASAAGEPLPLWMDLLRNAPVTLQQQSAHERAHRSALTKGPHMAKPHQLPTPAPLSPSYTLPPAGPSKVARPPTPIPRAALEAPAVAGEQQPVLEILPLQLLSKGPVDEHWLAALSPQVRALADSLINGQLMLQQLLLYNAQMGTQAQAPAAAPAAFVPAAAAPLIDRPAIPVQQLPVQQALASASGALAMEASAAMEAMAAAAAAQASPGSSQEDKENKQPANSPSSSKWKAQLC